MSLAGTCFHLHIFFNYITSLELFPFLLYVYMVNLIQYWILVYTHSCTNFAIADAILNINPLWLRHSCMFPFMVHTLHIISGMKGLEPLLV